jgi:hypothetical protein
MGLFGSLALLLAGGGLIWRYLLAPPPGKVSLAGTHGPSVVMVDAAGAQAATDAAPPPAPLVPVHAFDPRALAKCEQTLDATPQGAMVSRRGVLSEDFVALATAINDAFAAATPGGPGPVREGVVQRLEAAQLTREAEAATSCLFTAGAMPSGFRAALENFLRRNDAFRDAAPAYDVTALAVLLAPDDPRAAEALVRAGDHFQTWREGETLVNPPLRERAAAIARLSRLLPRVPGAK